MKIVVIGGSGLIGSRLVSILRNKGHEVLAASPDSGVNTITGEGLDAALVGAQVVVDVANSPMFDEASIRFFETAGTNLLTAEARAGVRHHVALSIVGTDRIRDSAYLRAKLIQENLIRKSDIPYSILRSTQFFEFIGRIAQPGAGDNSVRVSAALFQPILSADVGATLADVTLGAPIKRHCGGGWAGTIPDGRAGPACAAHERRPARGDRGRTRTLLRLRAQRPEPDRRPGRTRGIEALRRMAKGVCVAATRVTR